MIKSQDRLGETGHFPSPLSLTGSRQTDGLYLDRLQLQLFIQSEINQDMIILFDGFIEACSV